jgi:hypothetical protein
MSKSPLRHADPLSRQFGFTHRQTCRGVVRFNAPIFTRGAAVGRRAHGSPPKRRIES